MQVPSTIIGHFEELKASTAFLSSTLLRELHEKSEGLKIACIGMS